jgi:hypothetical protein
VDKLTSNPAAAFVGSTGDKATAVVGWVLGSSNPQEQVRKQSLPVKSLDTNYEY